MYSLDDPRIEDRVRARIAVSDTGCWLWNGPLNHAGYGTVSSRGSNWAIHRFVWTKLVGIIGAGLQLDHTCKVKNCCNPEHLVPVTPSQHSRTRRHPKTLASRTMSFLHLDQLNPVIKEIALKHDLPITVVSKILPRDNGCWEWLGYISEQGYGRYSFRGQNVMAHKAMKIMVDGEYDESLHLHHTCENKKCVNPAHLVPMTVSDHAKIGPSAQKQRDKTHCPFGHPYDDENTYRNNSSKSKTRRCKTCTQETNRKQYAKRLSLRGASPHWNYDIRRAIHKVVSVLGAPFDCRSVTESLGGAYEKMQVLRSLHKLGKQGLIDVVVPRSGRRPTVYRFNPKWTVVDPFEDNPLAKRNPSGLS